LSGNNEKTEKIKIYLSLTFTLIFFSLFEIISKKVDLNSFSLTGVRFFFGGLFIFIFFIKPILIEIRQINKELATQIFLIGFLNVSIAMLLLQIAVQLGNATTSAIIISSNPVFIFLIQNTLDKIKNKKIEKKLNFLNLLKFIFLIIGVIGIFLVVYKKDKGDSLISILFALLASISFAIYTLITKKLLIKVSAVTMNSISFSLNGLLLLAISSIIFKNDLLRFINNINIENLLFLIILSFGVTGFAYITYFYSLKRLDAIKVSLVFYLKPIIVLIFNFLFLNEFVGLNKFIGVIVIIFSLLIYINLDNLINLYKKL